MIHQLDGCRRFRSFYFLNKNEQERRPWLAQSGLRANGGQLVSYTSVNSIEVADAPASDRQLAMWPDGLRRQLFGVSGNSAPQPAHDLQAQFKFVESAGTQTHAARRRSWCTPERARTAMWEAHPRRCPSSTRPLSIGGWHNWSVHTSYDTHNMISCKHYLVV